MKSSMTKTILYSGPLSMFGAKAEIALREKGVAFELVMVPFDKSDRYEPRHPEVLRVNPKRQVPVLIHGDLELFDSTLISSSWKTRSPTRRSGRVMSRHVPVRGCLS
jgi:glutathione S-transferase